MDAWRLAVLGLYQRRGVSLVILLVAVTAVAAATAGPLYLRAGQESLLRDDLRGPPAATGIEVTAGVPDGNGRLAVLRSQVSAATRDLPGYGPLIGGLELNVQLLVTGSDNVVGSRLLYRDGACRHIVLVRGRCPTAPGEVAVSVTGAVTARVALRDRRTAAAFLGSGAPDTAVTVVGIWQARDVAEPYWFGRDYFVALQGGGDGSHMDAMLTPASTFGAALVVVDRPVDADHALLRNVPAMRRGLAALPARLAAADPELVLQSFLPATLDKAAREGDQLRRPVALVTGQLLVLAWFVLYTVVAGAASARGLEVALAKLRGFPPMATIAFALLETALVLVAAVPAGLLAGDLAVRALVGAALGNVPVEVGAATLLAAAGALAGALLAALLAAIRVVRQPVLTLLRRSTSARRGPLTVLAEVAVLAGGLVALLRLARPAGSALVTGSAARPSSGALLVPGLVAVVAALFAARLLPLFCRGAFAVTRDRQWVGSFLAVRQVARRPSGLRIVLVLGTAFGLATFAVVGDSVFAGNRTDRARAETGAAHVLTVDAGKADVLLRLVRAADPAGRHAMAVVTYDGGGSPARLVGMDTTRLASVPYWRSDLATAGAGETARWLQNVPAAGPVPAVVAAELDAPNGRVTAAGLDGLDLTLDARVRSQFVPRFGPRAAIADLGVLLARTTRPISVARAEVWLAPGSGAVTARLRAAGLRVDIDERASTRSDGFGRQAPSLALDLFLVGAAVAAVLALGGTVLDLYLLGRRRAFEIAAMSAVGLRRRQLVASVLVEQGVVLGTGAGVGIAAGLAAVALTLPAIPEFSDRYSFPAIVLHPDSVFVGVLVAAVAAFTTAGIVCAALLLVRSAEPGRLRESQP